MDPLMMSPSIQGMRMPRPVLLLLAAFMLTQALLGCAGCAGREKKKAAPASGEIAWELSPQAQNTYYSILLDLAMRKDDEGEVLHALDKLAALPEQDPRAFLEGSVWLLARKSVHALDVIEKGLSIRPGEISLNLLKAEALLEYGQAEKALAHMREFTQKYPDETDGKIELALLLVKLKQPEEAERILSALPPKSRSILAEYYHGRACNDLQRPDEALTHFLAAVRLSPDFLEAWTELAHLYERRKDLKQAREAYEQLLRLSAGNPDVLLRLIAVTIRMGEPQRALAFVRRGPDTPSFTLAAVSIFLDGKHWETAENLLAELRARPDPPEELYFYLAGIAIESRNSPEEALRWIGHITPDSTAYERAIALRVQLLGNLGKKEEALAFLRQERAGRPDRQDLLQLEIRLLASLQRWKEALELADAALRAGPENYDLAFLRASLLDEHGKKKEAFTAMEAIARAQPDHYQALNYLGYTLADENRELQRALDLLTKAAALAPDRAYIIDSLAWAQYRLGRFDAAWESISRATAMENSEDPTIWEHYGDIAAALGNAAEARKGYGKALEFNPPNAESIRRRLSGL